MFRLDPKQFSDSSNFNWISSAQRSIVYSFVFSCVFHGIKFWLFILFTFALFLSTVTLLWQAGKVIYTNIACIIIYFGKFRIYWGPSWLRQQPISRKFSVHASYISEFIVTSSKTLLIGKLHEICQTICHCLTSVIFMYVLFIISYSSLNVFDVDHINCQ